MNDRALAEAVPAGRREERKARNRAKLLVAAREVFARKGLGAATVRDIVRETDLAAGTFYNYFDDKEEVFAALLEDFSTKARVAVRAQRNRPVPVEERVESAYRAYFELVLEERELFEVIRRNAGSVALMTGEGLFEAGVRELFEDLREWALAGELPQVDLEYVAIAGAAAGFQLANALVERESPDVDRAARFCTRMFMAGIRALADDPPGAREVG